MFRFSHGLRGFGRDRGPCYELAVKTTQAPFAAPRAEEPFLARGALFALTLTPPLITLVTARLGSGPVSVVHVQSVLLRHQPR